MSGFEARLNQLCAGTASLDATLAEFHREPPDDKNVLLHFRLIETAWRAGHLNRKSYDVLRSAALARSAGLFPPAGMNDSPAIASRAPVTDSDRNTDTSPMQVQPERRTRVHQRDSGPNRRAASAAAAPARSNRPRTHDSGTLTNPSQWPQAEAKPLAPGSVLKERFVLERIIGRGGMGTIFRARDLRKEEAQDRHPYVAVKVLNEDFRRHPEALISLQREARKAQTLAHPNVATVFDFDRDGPVVFLVMELLEGVSLDVFIKSRVARPLPHAEAMRIVQALGAALAHAHQKGLVHADFKPANGFRSHDGTVKVLDFGIARAIGRRVHEGEHTVFDPASLGALTPCYASPEMLVGDVPDPRDDVYGLACVSYELFCSRHPFDFISSQLAERRGLKPAPIPGLDRRIWRALQHGLEFSRENRTPSVEAFLAEMEPSRRFSIAAAASSLAATVVLGAVAWNLAPGYLGDLKRSATEMVAAGKDIVVDEPKPEQREPAVNEQIASVAPPPESSPQPDTSAPAAAPVAATVATAAPALPVASAPRPAKAATPEPKSTVEQRKERLVRLAAADDLTEALELFRELQGEIPSNDPFMTTQAPDALAQTYIRLSDRAFDSGEFESAAALLTRAGEFNAKAPEIAARRESVDRVAHVAHTLEFVISFPVDRVITELEHIEASEGRSFPRIRTQLAAILVQRITETQPTAPERANELLDAAKRIFPESPAFAMLVKS
ncbi:MAG: serine/threonine-protein kinase [Steroidobacteraceae bacterium]